MYTVDSYIRKGIDYIDNDYIELHRFTSSYEIAYIIAFGLFIVLWILSELLSLIFMSCCWRCCCNVGEDLKLNNQVSTFSTNVYKELSFDDLKREYYETKDEIQELR